MRPLIGLTAYVEPARWGIWELVATLLPHRYLESLAAAGGRAVLLPPDPSDPAGDLAAEAADTVARLDGLLLTGGADIDPARYGAQRHPATTGLRPDRDRSELALLTAALALDVPVLGVCRGMQLMVVAAGGGLHQHLPDVVGHEAHRPEIGTFGEHRVDVRAGSALAGIVGSVLSVRSYHHQGIADLGSAIPVGWATDGAIEAIELPCERFAIGVLWHPEASTDLRLFSALVAAARGRHHRTPPQRTGSG